MCPPRSMVKRGRRELWEESDERSKVTGVFPWIDDICPVLVRRRSQIYMHTTSPPVIYHRIAILINSAITWTPIIVLKLSPKSESIQLSARASCGGTLSLWEVTNIMKRSSRCWFAPKLNNIKWYSTLDAKSGQAVSLFESDSPDCKFLNSTLKNSLSQAAPSSSGN